MNKHIAEAERLKETLLEQGVKWTPHARHVILAVIREGVIPMYDLARKVHGERFDRVPSSRGGYVAGVANVVRKHPELDTYKSRGGQQIVYIAPELTTKETTDTYTQNGTDQ